MRIGIDFDNTIVSYDSVFHKVAREGGLIPGDLPVSKLSVRDHLRRTGREHIWIEMQGYVYGARMNDAEFYPGVLDFFRWAHENGVSPFIISHKTKHPFAGPNYDLHEAARAWMSEHLRHGSEVFVKADAIYFELTMEEKLARIGFLQCGLFVDDLPEVLLAPAFPAGTEPLLFDPDGHHTDTHLARIENWQQLRQVVEQKCSRRP